MKKLLILALLAVLCLGAAQAEMPRKADLLCADIETEFAGWREVGHSAYGSGQWEGEMAHHCTVLLIRVADGQLMFRSLYVMMNPIEPGDDVPWEVTDFAPVPLTAEAFTDACPAEHEDYLKPPKTFAEDDRDTYVPGEE